MGKSRNGINFEKSQIQYYFMKKAFLYIPVIAFAIVSCKSTNTADPNTLPKDISERPADENSQKYDNNQLEKIKAGIDSEIAKEKCTDPSEWAFSPIGSKACGGPVTYIAYPKKLEASILPKIQEYTSKMAEYNKKYNITSDCMMANEPTSIRCEDEKAVLVYP
ncbi:hypothetical protein BCF50_0089 [Chryseobacterium daecheongense]|uniref:Uncharacterized protein n=2 Tax=Chryseobacterium daecheongense TaxID=192389 RepID=A0ABY2FX41_9FLAO|nr:hypothetical protein BCF50_0089 [Chryseobacterium daecheongense]